MYDIKNSVTKALLEDILLLKKSNEAESFLSKYLPGDIYSSINERLSKDDLNFDLAKLVLSLKDVKQTTSFFNKKLTKDERDSLKNNWLDSFGYFKHLLFHKKLIVVSITHECNASCWYCKISLGIKKGSHMKLKDFVRVLDWLEAQGIKLFIFTGGEPTIHPQFKEFMEICKKREFKVVFYSNFFFDKATRDVFNKDVFYRITCHYNPQYESNKALMHKFNNNLGALLKKGIEIEPRFVLVKEDYYRFLDFVEYHKFPFFTLNFVHPSVYHAKNRLTLKKIAEWKKMLFKFMKETERRNLKFYVLKPIPRCMFTEKEYEKYKNKLNLWTVCSERSQITVKPNMQVTWCNTDLFRPVKNIFEYDTTEEWREYFWQYVESLYWEVASMTKCKNCKHFIKKECQGGCLSFKNVKKLPPAEVFNYKN